MKTKAPLLLISAIAGVFAPEASLTAAEPNYPLTTCIVSGEALGSMGDAFIYTYKEEGKPDREVRLCCKGCLKKFTKEPAKYLAKLDGNGAKTDALPAASAPDAHAGHAH